MSHASRHKYEVPLVSQPLETPKTWPGKSKENMTKTIELGFSKPFDIISLNTCFWKHFCIPGTNGVTLNDLNSRQNYFKLLESPPAEITNW